MYEDPYTGHNVVLVVWNALYVPSMKRNLIPPFIIREKGIKVKDTPNIHMDEPDEDDHTGVFTNTRL